MCESQEYIHKTECKIAYINRMNRKKEVKGKFWEYLKSCIKACEDKGGIMLIGNMNARVRDNAVESVQGNLDVSRVSENGRKLSYVWKIK